MLREPGWNSGKEKEPQPASFEDMRLEAGAVTIKSDKTDSRGNTEKVYERTSEVFLEDGPAKLTVTVSKDFGPSGQIYRECALFTIGRDGGELTCSVTIWHDIPEPGQRKVFPAATRIVKNDPQKLLPLTLGVRLYKKALDLIAEMATQKRVPIKDEVSRELKVSDTPMTVEKWNRIFEPILSKEGYAKVEDGTWTKTYEPNWEVISAASDQRKVA